jgi:hypothetical protein
MNNKAQLHYLPAWLLACLPVRDLTRARWARAMGSSIWRHGEGTAIKPWIKGVVASGQLDDLFALLAITSNLVAKRCSTAAANAPAEAAEQHGYTSLRGDSIAEHAATAPPILVATAAYWWWVAVMMLCCPLHRTAFTGP